MADQRSEPRTGDDHDGDSGATGATETTETTEATETDRPATWENVVVGKAVEMVGKVLHRRDMVDEGEEQAEIAHDIREDRHDGVDPTSDPRLSPDGGTGSGPGTDS